MKRQNLALVLGLIALVIFLKTRDRDGRQQTGPATDDGVAREIDNQLAPEQTGETREGLAAAIAIDVSGSMAEEVTGLNGRREPKIDIARRAALDLVDQFASYARDHADEPVQLGVYEFSRRRGEPDCRTVLTMAPPDRARAASAIAHLKADGGTPIGQAMITAKRALDAAGLSRRHLLVVTDGENTDGVAPERVAVAIGKRPDVERPAIYFVAFDVDAGRFSRIRDAGGLVLSAANGPELNQTLDSLLRGKILVEK